MEKYSKAVSEMYSQFKQREVHPMEKYIGRHVVRRGQTWEIVGYTVWSGGLPHLIAEASADDGWTWLGENDVIVKTCEYYFYVSISSIID